MLWHTRHSPNHDARPRAPDLVVLHYTGMPTAEDAIERLCDPAAKVSAHWLIDEDGTIWSLVDENRRAWHAGVASWQRDNAVNARSIGIELVNPGHDWGYRPFPEPQMVALESLLARIFATWRIPPANIVGHSDVAPARKQDPGELFDWARLARRGFGLWPASDFIVSPHAPALMAGQQGPAVLDLQMALDAIGYGVEGNGLYDPSLELVVAAFQRHFRSRLVDGVADGETVSLTHHLAQLV